MHKKSKSRVQAFFLAILLIASACKVLQKKNNTSISSNTPNQKKIKTPVPARAPYNASRTLYFDILHTKLELVPVWEKQVLEGEATIVCKPYFYAQDSIVLDAKSFLVHKVKNITTGYSLPYRYDGRKIHISLGKKYSRYDTLTLYIKYTAQPNHISSKGSAAINDNRGLYFIDPLDTIPHKPKQLWTQSETEYASCWFPTIDSPNERCTQEMIITVDSSLTVLTNGKHVQTIFNKDGTKTEYWKQELPHAPYLFMMAIGKFSVVKDKWRDKEVSYYVEPEYEKYARDIFGHTPEMLEFFSNRLGYPYPWHKYSQVVVRDFVSGAMENTTASVFMRSLQCDRRQLIDKHWDGIIAHELFHHWFGNLVTCESWANLPLNESFANYAEYLWTEYKYGRDEADYLDVEEEEQYFSETTQKLEPLIRFHYFDKEDMFDAHSYSKGGRVLHMLRKYVGDEAFFESLKLYLHANAFSSVEIHNLRLAFERVTGEDLNWFFNQWFFTPGHPELRVKHEYKEDVLKIHFEQIHDTSFKAAYILPLAVDVTTSSGTQRHHIIVNKTLQTVSIPLTERPLNVLVDAEFQLLGKIYHNKKDSEYMVQYEKCPLYRGRKIALDALFSQDDSTAKNPFANKNKIDLLYKALKDTFWLIRFDALQYFEFLRNNNPLSISLEPFYKQIVHMAQNDSKSMVRARAIYMLNMYDYEKYSYIIQKALNDSSYLVVGTALEAYLASANEDKDKVVMSHEASPSLDVVQAIASYYIKKKYKDKYKWFAEKLYSFSSADLYYMLDYFYKYVSIFDKKESDRIAGKKVLESIAAESKIDWIKSKAGMYAKLLN
ncbi:MAG: M1 family metallopeptidase [Cytophagaceae bacterium]|nr:M1 family metallopeptidase [Cytophagaceae bacterium]MDW8457283.1 M1 family metallopeptidase [Cytophagaceae bacterium]